MTTLNQVRRPTNNGTHPPAAEAARIVMIDRQRAFVDAVAQCARATPDLRVVGSAGDLEEGEHQIRIQQPDLAVLEIDGAMESVLRLRETLAVRLGGIRLIVLTADLADRHLEHAIFLETSCVLKSEPLGVILEAFRQVRRGSLYFSPALQERLEQDPHNGAPRVASRSCLQGFTPKQLEVLKAVAKGQKVKEVARRLHLSPKSVEAHKYRIMSRLGIHDRVELCLYAVREGLIQP